MFSQSTTSRKRLLTQGTTKGFLPTVNSHMEIQITFLSKRLLTKGAAKGFLPSVNSQMLPQIIFQGE
jgi:hypothetical protein